MKKWICTLCALLLVSLTACGLADFNGSRIGNDSQLIMNYSIFNSTETQLLQLKQGDVIHAEIVSEAGRVSAVLQGERAEPVYKEENIPTGSFVIEIPESGTYRLTVTGDRAKGSLSFVKSAGL